MYVMGIILILGIIGAIISALPLIVLPIKIRAGIGKYILLYIFLFSYFLFIVPYEIYKINALLSVVYISQMLFFLTFYKAYMKKELLFVIPAVYAMINDFAVLFTFYFITFNLFELVRHITKKQKTSPLVLSATALFEAGTLLQLFEILFKHIYISLIPLSFFVGATIMFIIPGLRVAYEEEKI
jgi:hypothetical protein